MNKTLDNTIIFYVPFIRFDKHDDTREIPVCLSRKQRDVAEKILAAICNMKPDHSYYFVEVEHTMEEKE